LCTDTHTVSDLDILDFRSDLYGTANDFMAHADGERDFTPATGNSVDI
jgi:hypothetical protein